jgi:aconitate hydratase 2/2-methylisocitrate dehydratase
MSRYSDYLNEIEERKSQDLDPKPIDGSELLLEVIAQIKDVNHKDRKDSLDFFIYNVLPGTTSAAAVKADFLKTIIVGEVIVEEISPAFALEQLSHMKGGPSVKVLLDIALGDNTAKAKEAATVLKTQVYLYEADMARLEKAFKSGNPIAKDIIESYAKAEFFTKLPDLPEEIKLVTFVAGIGDISTDLLSPGGDAHSRSDRQLHGQCMFEHNKEQQKALLELQAKHPDKRVMLIAEKGTMGVGSSRMSGVNNVALWIGEKASRYIPFINNAPVVAGTNGISPIFLTTVGVTGGIGLDLKNWKKKHDTSGNLIIDENGDPVLEQTYSVDTGTVLTINTKTKKLYEGAKELMDISSAFTPQKNGIHESWRLLCNCIWKKVTNFCCQSTWYSYTSCVCKI